MNLVTISEASIINNISVNTIRNQVYKHKIQPIDKVKWQLNGYLGHPFKKEDIEMVISEYKNTEVKHIPEQEMKIKRYTSEEVCKVLRKHLNSTLWNKQISSWNIVDFRTFEKLKSLEENNIEVIDPETVDPKKQ